MPLINQCMAQWNILIGSPQGPQQCPFSLFEEKPFRYFTVKGTYFPHMGSLTWTNRKRYKEREQERRLKSRSEKAMERDYGDLKPLLPPRVLPVVFRCVLEHNEDSPSVHPAPHLSFPFYTVAAIRLVCVRVYVHVRE